MNDDGPDMKNRPPARPFSFDLPPEEVDNQSQSRTRPFQFDVEEPLEYEELRSASEQNARQLAEPKTEARTRNAAARWLIRFGILFLILVIGVDAYSYLSVQFERSLTLGLVLSMALAGVVLTLLWLVGREIRDYRRLQEVSELRRLAEAALAEPGQGQAKKLVQRFADLYRTQPILQRRLSQFEESIADYHTNGEILDRFGRVVIKPMDAQAYAIINRYAVDTAIVTAISPFAALDVLLSLWRNTRMIRAIASHYGVRPGFTGSLTLLKYVLQNLVTAGASHYVSDALAEAMGSDLVGKLSQRFSQGVINGLMTVRLGLMAAEQCRPLPFQPEDKHNFRQLFRNVRRRHEQYTQASDEHS